MSDRPPADTPDYAGTVLADKYMVDRLIGTGGMGTVWEGHHAALGTRVAIKFIRPAYASHQEARARFEIEARAAAKLQSKHAVHVYDYGIGKDGLPYIVMEFLEGESLSEAIIRRGALPPHEVSSIIAQASRALTKAHAAGIVHRDLKPDNIFLAHTDDPAEGLPYTVKLVDFGIAKIFEETKTGEASPMGGPTREGTVIGTPNFMAPEQLTAGGAPGPLTDLWSLGACTFAAMTARLPFEGEVLGDIVLKVCAEPMPIPSQINPSVPRGFDQWFMRACARDVAKRFQSANELADSLNVVCASAKRGPQGDDEVKYVLRARSQPDIALAEQIPVPGSMSPRTALMAGLVLGIAMMVGIIGFLAWRQSHQDDDRVVPSATASAPASSATGPSIDASITDAASPTSSAATGDAAAKPDAQAPKRDAGRAGK